MRDAILVTGGLGYIGSHFVKRLLDDGKKVVVLDNLSTGHVQIDGLFRRAYGFEHFVFEFGDLTDKTRVHQVFELHDIKGVVDFAAKSVVPESNIQWETYLMNNVFAFANLLLEVHRRGIPLVKSSTAATYGEPPMGDNLRYQMPLAESYQDAIVDGPGFEHSRLSNASVNLDVMMGWYLRCIVPTDPRFTLGERDLELVKIPTNVYGVTKLMDEVMMRHLKEHGLKYVALRYFNACGADGLIGEHHNPESHLIPIVLQAALGQRPLVKVFGNDYPVTDKDDPNDHSAVRDYIAVGDLADAHLECLYYLLNGGESEVFNLGVGKGASVNRVIKTAREVVGERYPIRAEDAPRRPGDPAELVANPSKIYTALGWRARVTDLRDAICSAWNWHLQNPRGYDGWNLTTLIQRAAAITPAR